MNNVISILPALHASRRQQMAMRIVVEIMVDPLGDNLVKAMRLPRIKTNGELVSYIIDSYYPSPKLATEKDQDAVMETLIGQMSFRSGMSL